MFRTPAKIYELNYTGAGTVIVTNLCKKKIYEI